MNYLMFGVTTVSFAVAGYLIGRLQGERLVKRVFVETIKELELELDENKLWVSRGEKINEVPAPRFGLIQVHGNYDRLFGLKQSMGKRIKSLFTKVGK